jgi:hypothetical protein
MSKIFYLISIKYDKNTMFGVHNNEVRMKKYSKKIQVLLTEEQFHAIINIADQRKKKLGVIVREAIEVHYLKKANQRKVSKAVNDLLELPEMPVPENYQEWEAQYQKDKYPN